MQKLIYSMLVGAGLFGAFCTSQADAGPGHTNRTYQVTITNMTAGETFTPLMVASHSDAPDALFSVGDAPSDALAAMAEGGDTTALQAMLESEYRVSDVVSSGGLLEPGQSATVEVTARPGRDRITLAGMLIPTNDAFTAIQNVKLPRAHKSLSLYTPAYDAGSEPNDELCISIPGPVCGGTGGSPGVGGEGFVYIHSGIHGIGDLAPSAFDWNNPVAKIVIQRAK